VITGVPDDGLRSRHRLGERRRRPDRRRLASAVLLGTTLAALGSSAGAWLGWRDTPALPSFDEGAALVQGIAPGKEIDFLDMESPLLGSAHPSGGTGIALVPLAGGNHFGAGYIQVGLDADGDAGLLRDVADRLAGAGWDVRRDGEEFRATAQGLRLDGYPSNGSGDPAPTVGLFDRVTLMLARAEPRPVLPLALLGLVGGGALAYGWLRARSRLRGRYRTVADAAALTGVLALLPTTLLTAGGLALRLAGSDAASTVASDAAYILPALRPVTLLGLAALAVALATPPARRADRELRDRLAARAA
jgi:hypothetical protein